MKKRVLAGLICTGLVASLLMGCGGQSAAPAGDAVEAAAEETAEAAEEAAPAEENGEAPVYKVGIVQFMDHASLNQIETSIEKQLDARGAEMGVTFNYADYTFNGEGDATTLNQIAAQLLDDQVDVIVAIATPSAQIMQAACEESGTKIVFSAVTDPVGAGLVESLDKPGANITGTSDALNTEAVMNLILAANPDTAKVGLLYSKSEDASTQAIADAKAFLEEKGIACVEKTGTTTDEVNQAVDALLAEGVDAVFTPTDNTIMNAELAIYEKFTGAGVPHYAGADSFALNGAFLGFGINYADLGTATGDIVADILAGGKDTADYPVVILDSGIATINTETCEALGMDLAAVKEAFAPYCSGINEIVTAAEFE